MDLKILEYKKLLSERKYYDIEYIGAGTYGLLFKCKNKQNKIVAIKIMKNDDCDLDDINNYLNEAIHLIKLNHSNIVKVYNAFLITPSKLCIEMEYLQNGALSNLIKDKIKLNEKLIIKILTQCYNALLYLEENGIIHRDLNLNNILIKHLDLDNDEIEIILIDFGFIKLQNSTFSRSQVIGTDGYLAPELLENNDNYIPYSYKSDVFAVGVTLYRLMSFDLKTDISQLHYILDNDNLVKDKLIKNIKNNYYYSDNLINLVLKLLEKDSNNRYNAKQVLNEINLFENKNNIHSFSNEFIYCKTIGNGRGSISGQFCVPFDIKIDEKDKLIFVADTHNDRIQVFDFNGIFQYQIKTPMYPTFIAIDYFRNGKEILVGCKNAQKICRFEKKENGKQLNEIIGTGKGSGNNEFDFTYFGGIIIDEKTGNIYISDDNNNRIKVYSNSGQLLKIIKNYEKLQYPCKLDFNSKGQLVVTNRGNGTIVTFDLNGNLISSIEHEIYIKGPFALVVDKSNDNIIIGNYMDHSISVFDKNGKFIKTFGKEGKGIGEFNDISALALDSNNGQLYVMDCSNYRIQIFK